VKGLRHPRILRSTAAGILTALALWLLPLGPRAVLPAVDRLRAIFFAPDARSLVTLQWNSGSKDVMVDADTGREAVDLARRHGIQRDFRRTGMDEYVVFADGKQMSIVHLGTGALTAAFTLEGAMDAHGVYDLTSDGKSVSITGRTAGRPHYIFDARTGAFQRLPAADAKSWSALSPDRFWLITGADVLHRYERWRRFLPEWARPRPKCASEIHDLSREWHVAHFPGVTGAKFSPDGQTLALIGDDGTVQLWDIPLRTPWAIVATRAMLAAAIVYMMTALRLHRRGKPEVKP